MADELSALVNCNNDVTATVNSFNNTFENMVKVMQEQLLAIQARLLADGGYANFNAARADISNQMSAGNAAIVLQTYNKIEELGVVIWGYHPTDPIATRAAVVEAIMVKVAEVVPLMARV